MSRSEVVAVSSSFDASLSSFRAVILAAGDPVLRPVIVGGRVGAMRLDTSVLEPLFVEGFAEVKRSRLEALLVEVSAGGNRSRSGLDSRLTRGLGLWAGLASEQDTALGTRRKAVTPQTSK